MNLRDAATLALEALELHAEQYPHMQKGYTVDAITALRAALEEDKQTTLELCETCGWRTRIPGDGCLVCERNKPSEEPYCYIYETDSEFGLHRSFYPAKHNGRDPDRSVPVYLHPPRETSEDPDKYCLTDETGECVSTDPRCMHQPGQAREEPAAWLHDDGILKDVFLNDGGTNECPDCRPLHLHPPREYVPLTDEERTRIWNKVQAKTTGLTTTIYEYASAIEAAVLERMK